MVEQELKVVAGEMKCQHSAATILGPDGVRYYGRPTATGNCLDCAWQAYEQSCGKNVELPAVQIFYWSHSEERPAHWVAEVMPLDLIPDVVSVVGRGSTPADAVNNLASQITSFLSRQLQ